jgi:site-specific DNA-methyltransferase (adenine-specific)
VRPGVNELKLIVPERAILISTNPDDLVFDPFGGGGSTFQAAELHGRYWLGTELYDSDHIVKRMRERFPISSDQEPFKDFGKVFKGNEDHKNQVL